MREDKYLAISQQYVVKSNDIIQRSRFKLNLQQQKMVLYIVSQIKKDDSDFQKYTFDIIDFCRICGLDSIGGTNYQILKESLEELKGKTLWIQRNDDSELLVSWLGFVEMHPKSGTVDLSLDPVLKPYLLNLQSRFTQFQLEKVLSLKSKYSPRLYEILKSYLHENEKVLDFKKLLYLLDFPEDSSYKEYKYLNRDILKPSIAEINRKTDIFVEYSPVRRKHKVTDIRFTIENGSTQDTVSATLETRGIFVDEMKPKKKIKISPAEQQQPEPDRAQATEDSSQTVTTIVADAAAKPKKPKAAEQLPIPMDKPKRESKGKRYQVRIFARGTKTLLKTFSKYSVDEVVSAANEWLHNNGYPQIDKFTGSSLRWEV